MMMRNNNQGYDDYYDEEFDTEEEAYQQMLN